MEEVITYGRSRGQPTCGFQTEELARLKAETIGAFPVLTPEQLERIAQAVPGGATNIQDICPLVPLQEEILFHHLLNEQGGESYVLPMLFAFDSQQGLNAFIQAFQQVMGRHDILRTAVLWEELPRPVQVVHRRAVMLVEELVIEPHRDPEEQLRERMSPDQLKLDLTRAPLIKLQAAADPWSDQRYALVQLHHLLGDRESLEVLVDEVQEYLADWLADAPHLGPVR